MWLHLVNGVYCFLPKDSCSLIWPLIYPLFFLSPFLSTHTFLPLLSDTHNGHTEIFKNGYTAFARGADEWENAHMIERTHEPCAARLRGSSRKNKGIGEKEVKLQREAVRARVSYRMWHTPLSLSLFSLSESYTIPDDPLCSRNSLGKQGGPWLGRNGREGSPRGKGVRVCDVRSVQLNQIYII